MDTHYTVDWLAHIKLALVLSAAAVIVAIGLADHIAESTLIVGVIVVASLATWSLADGAPEPRPVRLHIRRR